MIVCKNLSLGLKLMVTIVTKKDFKTAPRQALKFKTSQHSFLSLDVFLKIIYFLSAQTSLAVYVIPFP